MSPARARERLLPVVTAFVLCDHVHQDLATEKRTILGATTRFPVTHGFPARCSRVGVYACVSSVHAPCVFTVELLSVGDLHRLGPAARLGFLFPDDPLAGYEMHENYPDVGVPSPGKFLIRLCADGRPLQELVVSFEVSEESP